MSRRRSDDPLVKKSVTLNQEELDRVKAILGAPSESEALRILIRERLWTEAALGAQAKIAAGKGIELVEWR